MHCKSRTIIALYCECISKSVIKSITVRNVCNHALLEAIQIASHMQDIIPSRLLVCLGKPPCC